MSRRERRARQDVGHADHPIHRRADLVTHIGEEFCLGFGGVFCRRLGDGERLLGLTAASRFQDERHEVSQRLGKL